MRLLADARNACNLESIYSGGLYIAKIKPSNPALFPKIYRKEDLLTHLVKLR